MADETPAAANVPPKVSPLIKPGLKLPPKPGLAAGLKLPPKPGLAAGLKLPPKPGLAAGIKLPPKPGAPAAPAAAAAPAAPRPINTVRGPAVGAALRPNIPAKPVIRKPGAIPATPVVRPSSPVAPAAPVAAAPAPAPAPAPVAPAPAATPAPAPTPAPAAAAAPARESVADAPKPMEALKSVTQKLKGITQQVPQQAILHKTGIIAADGSAAEPTNAQKQAAKSKTARISLSDAMGVAPVKEPTPMKTIRIKRPVNLAPSPAASAAPAPAPAPAAPAAAPAAPAVAEDPTLTQRKTLKITRPAPGGARPANTKFAIKKPGASDNATTLKRPTPVAAPAAAADVSSALVTVSTVVQAAACVAMGALGYLLYEACQRIWF